MLNIQLVPEQAAIHLNSAVKNSTSFLKSPKGISGLLAPGHESYPEKNSSVKM